MTLLACEMSTIVRSFEHSLALPFFGIGIKTDLSSPVATAEFSKLGKEYIKAVYCHPVYLTSTQNTSYEMLGWMKHKLESRLLGETSVTSHIQMTLRLWKKAKN